MRLTEIELSPDQIEAFGAELDELARRTQAKVGAEDAAYIRKMMKRARHLDAAGRALLMASLFPPAWLAGTTLLGLAKILDNMEIGHNVMHGQYDFMNDPAIQTGYEWDTVSDGAQWRHSHNYVHHTFTNVLGVDHDIGYRGVRVSADQPWHPKHLANLPTTFAIATVFEWAVGIHDMNAADAILEMDPAKLETDKLRPFLDKATRQVAKDYVLFPVLAGPMATPVLLGNLAANLMRNYWAWAVIFCGHFPEGTALFTQEQIEGESRGQWYLRQMMGSANIEGGRTLHTMTGHLSHQIEHHLFPTIPAWRYPAMAPEVQAIAAKYGVAYNTGSLGKQMGSMLGQVARLSLPTSPDELLNWRRNATVLARIKRRGMEILDGVRDSRPAEVVALEPGPRPRLRLPKAVRRVSKIARGASFARRAAAA